MPETATHPVTDKLACPVKYHARAGLWVLEFKELPTVAELQSYAHFRQNQAREDYKAVKGMNPAARASRATYDRMQERWGRLASAPSVRVDVMRESQANGEKMRVYF